MLDIFKNNDYKVDTLKQNFANKIGRRRVKMNLEKAITKNFFDTNLFDALINANESSAHNNSTSSNTNKAVKFQSPSSSLTKHSKEPFIKNVKETNTTTTTTKSETPVLTPAMFKIANKIKRAKDSKQKKTLVETDTENFDPIAVESTKLLASPGTPQKLEMAINRKNESTSVSLLKSPIDEESFTERITEV